MQCQQCHQPFAVTDTENQFLSIVCPTIAGVPFPFHTPQLCPRCRTLRRCSFRNERILYHRKCDKTGKEIISIYKEATPFPVYDQKVWWSDQWDAMDYGRAYDFNQSFFAQWQALQAAVPRLSLLSTNNENSDYTNCVSYLKNSYLLFSSDYNQDCLYGVWVENSRDSVDNLVIDHSELTYYSFFSQNLYNCQFVLNSSQCTDSAFLYDCRNTKDCFMSVGLRNKQYCIENKQYSREEYEQKRLAINLKSHAQLTKYKHQFLELIKTKPRLYMDRNGRVENSTGNLMTDVENCFDCFDITNSQDCSYSQGAMNSKNIQHCSFVFGEQGYENCECVPNPQQSAFNINCYTGNNLWYCDTCMNNCQDCFGCIGLRHQQYCILNKQYTKAEYEELLPKIIAQMKADQSWGEFFPMTLSPFAFNETTAYDYFPLTKERVTELGGCWHEAPETHRYHGQPTILDDIVSETEDVSQKILACETCQKQYRIIPQELRFYQKIGVALPRSCFDCRHRERLTWKNGWTLWDRTCAKCTKVLKSTYKSSSPEIIFCQECYQQSLDQVA